MSSISGIQLARVSNLLVSNSTESQIQKNEQQLFAIENQLSTGKTVNVPSDNPASAAIILQLQKTMDVRSGYSTNLQAAHGQLAEVDSTLTDLTGLVQQAVSAASANVSSDVSPSQRASAATLVEGLSTQVLAIANKQFNGQYLFGGDKSVAAPFVSTSKGVQFVGSNSVLQNQVDNGTSLPISASAQNVFGALSSRVNGATNLTPSLQTTTLLSTLGGTSGNGVQLGSILLGNGIATRRVDLSNASNLGDVVNDINNANLGNITAQLSPAGNSVELVTSGSDNIAVQEVGGGTTAHDLGIFQGTGGGAGLPVVGTSLQPKVTLLTPLANLRNGTGIDTTHGMTITDGGQSATIDLSGATDVEDLLNAIKGSGIGVTAQINSAGNGIDLQNATQGAVMTVSENGGTTASDLGVRSFSPSTLLSQLNNGAGVRTVAGADFQITNSAGASFQVDLSSVQTTVQDVIDAINNAATTAGVTGVTAGFATTGNGITLSDTAGGGGVIAVTPLNFSNAAADLGLTPGAVGNTIAGTDVNGVSNPGIFSDLTALRKALQSNDQAGITAAGAGLQNDLTTVTNTHGAVGANLQQIGDQQAQMSTENVATQSLLSTLQDTDFATAVTQFQQMQNALQATLQTAARSLNLNLMNFLA